MAIKDDVNELRKSIREMENHIQFAEETLDAYITNATDFDLSIKDTLRNMTEEDLANISEENLHSYAKKTGVTIDQYTARYDELLNSDAETKPDTLVDFVRLTLSQIREKVVDVDNIKTQKKEVEEKVNSAITNYFEYINSPEYKEKHHAKIDELKKQAETETDPLRKKRLLQGVENLEAAESLSFIFNRINIGEKEIKNIVDIFFSSVRSAKVLEKFNRKITSYGYNQKMFGIFYNLEEKFLPEEYYDFNNLFTFHVARFIAYSDPNSAKDKLFVAAILKNLYNLVYHKFCSDEDEKVVIELIKAFDDKFFPYKEKFTADNVLSPNHPHRKAADVQYELRKRNLTIAKLREMGVEPDLNLSNEELLDLFKKTAAEKKAELEAKREAEDEAFAESIVAPLKEKWNNDKKEEEAVEDVSEEVAEELSEDIEVEATDEIELTPEQEEALNAIEALGDDVIMDPGNLRCMKTVDSIDELPDVSDPDQLAKLTVGDTYWVKSVASKNEATGEITYKLTKYVFDGSGYIFMEDADEDCEEIFTEEIGVATDSNLTTYYDKFACKYEPVPNSDPLVYTYYDENDEIIEENVPEREVLNLINTNNLTLERPEIPNA